LNSRKLRNGENPREFAEEILHLCSICDPKMSEIDKIGKIKSGLPTQIQKDIFFHSPPTSVNQVLAKLGQLAAYAFKEETIPTTGLESLITNLVERITSAVNPRQQQLQPEPIPCNREAPVLVADTRNQQQDLVEAVVRRLQPHLANSSQRNNNRSRPQTPQCFNCGRPGHVQRNCRSRRQNRGNNYNRGYNQGRGSNDNRGYIDNRGYDRGYVDNRRYDDRRGYNDGQGYNSRNAEDRGRSNQGYNDGRGYDRSTSRGRRQAIDYQPQ
ncbi:hypothetical protein B4U80_12462, partial [Leptotrombidium deliense]